MPLILLCGYPCSGKSVVASKLTELLLEKRPDCEVELISEEAIACSNLLDKSGGLDSRAAIFASPALEKQLRSQIKFQVEKSLSCKKGNSACVLVDANNYIKGYRYELYCIAKNMRHQQAIVHCTTPEATCRSNNAQASRYPEELFTDLVNRFERPNSASRWDNPLYEISLPDSNGPFDSEEELRQSLENLSSHVILDLFQSTVKVKPNRSTIPSKSSAIDYIQIVEKATNTVIDLIITAQSQGHEEMALPNQEGVALRLVDHEAWTLTALAKAKRNFLAFVRAGLGAGVEARITKRANEAEISALFVRFLGNRTQQFEPLT